MKKEELTGILHFLREAEQLKTTYRSGYTSAGRTESVAEHTWRLCLMVLVLERHFPEVDMNRVLRICIVHDLGEAIHGDIPAPRQEEISNKAAGEREDLLHLVRNLSDDMQQEIVALWDEYENAATPEARTAKALDKLETLIQHNQGDNPEDFDYAFNLDYGKEYTGGHPIISTLREVIDKETERRARGSNSQDNG